MPERAGYHRGQSVYRVQVRGRGVTGRRGAGSGGALPRSGRRAACSVCWKVPGASRSWDKEPTGQRSRAGKARAQLSWGAAAAGGRTRPGQAPSGTCSVESRRSESPRPEVRRGLGRVEGPCSRRVRAASGRPGQGTRGHPFPGEGRPDSARPKLLVIPAWKSPHSFLSLFPHLRI